MRISEETALVYLKIHGAKLSMLAAQTQVFAEFPKRSAQKINLRGTNLLYTA